MYVSKHILLPFNEPLLTDFVADTALSFLIMFSAFQTCQTMVTSMFTDVGNISLAVLYSFYSVTCLLGPSIVEAVGIKKTICACGVLYVSTF
jgi:hypothetical protein